MTYTEREYLDNQFEQIHRRMDVYDKLLLGNGQPGLVTRVATLEGDEKTAKKWDIAAIGTGVMAFIAGAAAYFQSGGR